MESSFIRTAKSSINREGLMRRTIALTITLGILLAACGTATLEATPTSLPTIPPKATNTPPPTATVGSPTSEIVEVGGREGEPLPAHAGELFSTSGACTFCHMNMTDDSGADVSIDAYWRSTMMANAARDPYWQAAVRREVENLPDLSEVIQDKCSNCHMPMAQYTASVEGGSGVMFGDEGFLALENELNKLALDGVSCTLCHQVRSDGLGTAASYSGGFTIDTTLRRPERLIFGPYKSSQRDINIMAGASGYVPEQGLHLTGSELCATCHTLYTPYVDASGEIAGEFAEQVPYFEWYYSDYRSSRNCQDCHMPEAEGGVSISTTSQKLRSPFAKHSFIGGNVYMLTILNRFGEELGVTASSEHFQATIERTLDQMQNDTAILTLDQARLSGGRVILDVTIENLAGHKFPTGYPSRRAWLHVKVTDSNGAVVFESGGVNSDGSIIGNDNDLDPAQYEQHYQAIVQEDQVQIYETILRDSEREVTTTLLHAAGYLKDNRLLPTGFDKSAPYEDFAVRGLAFEDIDFDETFDQIQYVLAVGESTGPYQIMIELLYQSVGYRWIANLDDQSGSEIERFLGYVEEVPNQPVVIDAVELQLGD
jgi:hypothetical protein